MQIDERMPLPAMIDELRCKERVRLSEICVVCRGEDQSPAGNAGDVPADGENVICPLHGGRQEDDAVPRPLPFAASGDPVPQKLVLICVVELKPRSQTFVERRIDGLRAHIHLERYIERPAACREPEKAVGLDALLPHRERQFVLAVRAVDRHVPVMSCTDGLDDDLRELLRVCEMARSGGSEEGPRRLRHIVTEHRLKPRWRQLVVVLKTAADRGRRPVPGESRLFQRVQPLPKSPLVTERSAVERPARGHEERRRERRPAEESQKRTVPRRQWNCICHAASNQRSILLSSPLHCERTPLHQRR